MGKMVRSVTLKIRPAFFSVIVVMFVSCADEQSFSNTTQIDNLSIITQSDRIVHRYPQKKEVDIAIKLANTEANLIIYQKKHIILFELFFTGTLVDTAGNSKEYTRKIAQYDDKTITLNPNQSLMLVDTSWTPPEGKSLTGKFVYVFDGELYSTGIAIGQSETS